MSAIDGVVPITLTGSTPVPSAEAFDAACLLSGSTSSVWTTPERTREYASYEAVIVDFTVGMVEALEAAAYFAQSPKPSRLVIAKLSAPPTMTAVVSLTSLVSGVNYAISLRYTLANGTIETVQQVAITSATALNDSIIAQLVSQFNTVFSSTGVIATATGSALSKVMTITGTGAGVWFAVEPVDATGVDYGPLVGGRGLIAIAMTTAEPGTAMATQIAAIQGENDSWLVPINPYKGLAIDTAIAVAMRTKNKLYDCATPDTAIITTVLSGATDLAGTLAAANDEHTSVIFHSKPYQFADSCQLGRCLSVQPGFVDFGMRADLVGPTADKLSDTHIANADAKHAQYLNSVAGLTVIRNGTVAKGTQFSIMRDRLFIMARLKEGVFGALVAGDKLPYSNAGFAIIAARIRKVLDAFVGNALSGDPDEAYEVVVPRVEDATTSDRAAGITPTWVISAVQVAGSRKVPITLALSQ